jgi:hypothetical protein
VFAFAGGAPTSWWDPFGFDYGDFGPVSPAIPGANVPSPDDWQHIDGLDPPYYEVSQFSGEAWEILNKFASRWRLP